MEYLPCGTMWVAADEEEMAEVRRKKSVYDGIGVRAEVLDPQALAEAEPNLRRGTRRRAAGAGRCGGLSAVRGALSAGTRACARRRRCEWASASPN